MKQHPYRLVLLLLLLSTLLLSSCGPIPGELSRPEAAESTLLSEAESLAARGHYTRAASLYRRNAEKSDNAAHDWLRAAELMLLAKRYLQSANDLAEIAEDQLTPLALTRKRIAEAELALHDKNYSRVIQVLAGQDSQYNSRASQLRHAELLLAAFRTLSKPLEVIQVRAQLSGLLSSSAKIDNEKQLWQALKSIDLEQLDSWQASAIQPLSGWAALAQTWRVSYSAEADFKRALSDWQTRHQNHPMSRGLLNQILQQMRRHIPAPEKIAIVLPLSGDHAKEGLAILAGLEAAAELNTSTEYRPVLRHYDSKSISLTAFKMYQQAVQDGADFVIGAYTPGALEQFARQSKLKVPLLALSEISSGRALPKNLFQFTLNETDQAQQVAQRAISERHKRAIIITPDNEWGSEVAESFKLEFERLAGTVLTTEVYQTAKKDHSETLKQALHISQSEQRNRALRKALGIRPTFEPRRRQDVDMIFLLSEPATARLLRPQIDFYYATDLAVYSTSRIFSGIQNIARDRDIDGTTYCDMPWILQTDASTDLLRDVLLITATDSYNYAPRLTALGIDAYRIPSELGRLMNSDEHTFNGVTGELHLSENGRLKSQLTFAKFRKGRARPLHKTLSLPEIEMMAIPESMEKKQAANEPASR